MEVSVAGAGPANSDAVNRDLSAAAAVPSLFVKLKAWSIAGSGPQAPHIEFHLGPSPDSQSTKSV